MFNLSKSFMMAMAMMMVIQFDDHRIQVLAQTADNGRNLSCYTAQQSNSIESRHCSKALNQIIYDSNAKLDAYSNTVFVWHKSCVVNIQKKTEVRPSKQQIESSVQDLLQNCPSRGGLSNNTGSFMVYVYQAKDYNVYETNRPVCLKHRCHIQSNDCLNAFNQIPVDTKGHFVSKDLSKPYYLKASSGNCTVSIATTDYSAFRTTHPEINPTFKSLLNQCGDRVGFTYYNGGTISNNGDIRITTRHLYNDTLCR